MNPQILVFSWLLASALGTFGQAWASPPDTVAYAPTSSEHHLSVSEMTGNKVLGTQDQKVGDI